MGNENNVYKWALVIMILRTVIGTIMSVFLTAMLAYGLSKRELVGRKFFMLFCVFTMFFSGGLIPTFLLIRELGLMNSFWVMIIPMLRLLGDCFLHTGVYICVITCVRRNKRSRSRAKGIREKA